ncbi:hypothetical protein TWF481_001469 [Arthrobotrys musiformis]|uniref:Ricin B lectin domain-containing protein n=1 Tax=Arthrobotrys musiformis TaxID=47236 RepID=A0AAV9WSX9_9PEZI
MATKKLKHEDYAIGWTTVLETELNASRLLLDEEHEPLLPTENDDNSYILGRIGAHNVAITFAGVYGTNAAAHTVSNMLRTFPNIRFGLLVGVGGAAPGPPNLDDPSQDIRLGDIVVGEPKGNHGGVLQYDVGKWDNEEEFTIKSHLQTPPNLLLKAVRLLKSDHSFHEGEINQYIQDTMRKASSLPKLKGCRFPGYDQDKLFEANHRHVRGLGNDCSNCDSKMMVRRSQRGSEHIPEVHYGLIASSNTVMKSAEYRDKLRNRWNVSCFEMEAAGLMDNFPCVAIRGISDYSDSHKSHLWQPYAAIVAAAYAKDLLRVIRAHEVTALPPAPRPPSPNLSRNRDDVDRKIGAATQKEFDQLRGILEKIEARLLTLEGQVSSSNQCQDVLEKTETRLLALEGKPPSLSQCQEDLQKNEAKLTALEEKIASLSQGQEGLQRAEAQLLTLEGKIANLGQNQDLKKFEARLLTLEKDIASLSQGQDALEKVRAQLMTLEGKVATLTISTTPKPKPFPLKEGAKYKIINAAGGTAIDLTLNNSQVIHGWESHNGQNQKWILGKKSNGQWTLKNCHKAVYLGVGGKFQNGTHIRATNDQYGWDIHQDDDLPFYFDISRPNNQRPDLNVDLGAGKSANGSAIVIWEKYLKSDSRRNQKWIFIPV